MYEDPKHGPQVRDITEKKVNDSDDAVDAISIGQRNRHTAFTLMNAASSRSHTICKITVRCRQQREGSSAVTMRHSQLCIIDLAGSERASKTGAKGARLNEAKHINKSLMTLGTIISQLSKPGFHGHPPYRDSKLTRLLSTSLGGNAVTGLVCCVSPAVRNREETRSTMEFASRAKKIVNRATVNETRTTKALLNKYKHDIESLKEKLSHMTDYQAKFEEVSAGGGGVWWCSYLNAQPLMHRLACCCPQVHEKERELADELQTKDDQIAELKKRFGVLQRCCAAPPPPPLTRVAAAPA